MVISIANLSLQIAQKKLCTDLSACIKSGEIWGILGCNGSGKTSLLHTLAGLRKINSGEILLDRQPLEKISNQQRARKLAILFQDYEDYFPATVLETVLIGRHPHSSSWRWENKLDYAIAEQALVDLGISHLQRQNIFSLSGGERRLVAIATLLARQPDVFLLDEPTNHLDIKHQHQILKLFQIQAKQGNKTIIMSLHDINQAQQYCDHIIILLPSSATLCGAAIDLLTEEILTNAYQYPIKKINANGYVFFTQSDYSANLK